MARVVDHPDIGENRCLEKWVRHRVELITAENVHRDAEHLTHSFVEREVVPAQRFGQSDNQIDVATRLGFASSNRAVEFKPGDAQSAAQRRKPPGDFPGRGRQCWRTRGD